MRFRKKENESIDSFKTSIIELNREYTITDKVLWVELMIKLKLEKMIN